MLKNILIVTGLAILLYACTPVHAQPIPPTQEEIAGCYQRVNAAARDSWAGMSKLQRLQIGMRAISVCEGIN